MTKGEEPHFVLRGELPPRLLNLAARSQELDWTVRRLVGELVIPQGVRPGVASALYTLSLEHGTGVLSLLSAGNTGSALALLRPQAEALGRACWARYVAGDQWLDQLVDDLVPSERPSQFHKRPERILEDLHGKAPPFILNSLGIVLSDKLMACLHDLTHGGRSMIFGQARGHVAEILLECILLSNAITNHAAAELVSLCTPPGSQIARRLNKLSRAYRDCFLKIPHGWSPAPSWLLPHGYLHGHNTECHPELADALGYCWEAWIPGLAAPHAPLAD